MEQETRKNYTKRNKKDRIVFLPIYQMKKPSGMEN